jgi:ABC-2 type transport system permease protein
MTMTQNAFANTSSSLVIAKVQGNIVDLLMPPLSPLEVTLAIVLGGMTRGLVVGLVVGLSMIPFVPLSISHPGALIYFAASGSLLFSTLGVLGGIWSEKFDHIAAVTNFVVMPLTFLSGTFYSIDRLPEFGQAVARVDPLFYVVDGFRWGFIDTAETSIGWGVAMLALLNLVLVLATWRCFATGWKLKA